MSVESYWVGDGVYGVAGVAVTAGGAGVVLAFTGAATMALVLVAMVLIVTGLGLIRYAAVRRTRV
jgi:hypothetical protein